MLRERPAWEGEPPAGRRSDEAPTTRLPEDPSQARTRRIPREETTERLWEDEPPG
jgi:hypothetical protein